MKGLKGKIIVALILIFSVVTLGTIGYISIEGWDFLDAFYMTIITLASVGFREVHDLSPNGRIFTIVLITSGVGTFAYAFATLAKIVLEGEIQEIFGRKRLEKKIEELKDHYIVCGYGRMGRIICKELKAENLKFIAIEKDASFEEKENMLIMKGDATNDEILKHAGITRAKGLISVLPTDAENLYVVLSARELNPKLYIVARAGEEDSEKKLMRAGADKVVSPYHIGGLRIAHTVLKPAVVDFIEFATKSGNIDLQMEEINVEEGSRLSGFSLDECGIGRELGVIIVAVKKNGGDMEFNPNFKTIIEPGDKLIALVETPKLKKLEDMARA